MVVNKTYFEECMGRRKLSLRALAKRMDMTHSQLSLTFSGARRMQLDEAAKLAQIFSVTLDEIATNAGVSYLNQGRRRVSVIGRMDSSGAVIRYGDDVVERTFSPDGLSADAKAIQARTAESPLSWMDRFVFFFEDIRQPPAEVVGRFCLCQVEGGSECVGTLRRGYQDGTFNLSGPATMESARLEWATPLLLTRN